MLKVNLKDRSPWRCKQKGEVRWKAAPPFVLSTAGILVHRVRFVSTYMTDDYTKVRHTCVVYWCGNGVGSGHILSDVPHDGRIVCETCERRAVKAGEKSTDEIAGKHVHKGVLRAHKTCCDDLN